MLKLFLGCSLVLVLLWKTDIPMLLGNFSTFSPQILVVSIALYILALAVASYRWHMLITKIPYKELLLISFVGLFYSLILPGQIAGEVIKAYRLGKGRTNSEQIAASVLVDKLIGLLGLLAVASLGMMASHSSIPVEISLSIGLCALFIFIGLFSLKIPFVYLLISARLKKTVNRWPRLDHHVLRTFRLLDAWENYLAQPLRLFYAFMLGAVFQLICVWIIILFSNELGINLPFADWCWISGLVSMAVLLPISVGGIGVREGAFAGALSLQGVPIERSIALSLAVFAISLLGALIGGLLELFSKSHPRT